MGIGENIRKFRNAHAMDQKYLGELLHVSDKTISSWECGRTEPKIGMIENIAEIFGVTKNDILEGNVYASYSTPDEFELAWHKSKGGRHPLDLTDVEYELVLAFRCADTITKRNILRIFGLETKEKNDSSSSKEA